MDTATLSNNLIVVLFAYVIAFLPWTAISSTDFLSSNWVSVRHARRAGYRNLFWTAVPMLFVIAYAVSQFSAENYTEMAAAIVAFVFAAQCLVRTLWGLASLREFRLWAVASIRRLRAIGVPCAPRHPSFGKQASVLSSQMAVEDFADILLVNDTIVDNAPIQGTVLCHLTYHNIDLHRTDPTRSDTPSTIQLIFSPLLIILKGALIFVIALLDTILSPIGLRPRPCLRMKPSQPVILWTHWGSVFAAQVLHDWMSSFAVRQDPDTAPRDDSISAHERCLERGKYFSSLLAASASMHLIPELSSFNQRDNSHPKQLDPFLFPSWGADSNMTDGRLVPAELFEMAVSQGSNCLPFSASHRELLQANAPLPNACRMSYRDYGNYLEAYVTSLPIIPSFSTHIQAFDAEMLSWLAIFLFLGERTLNINSSSGPTSLASTNRVEGISEKHDKTDVDAPVGAVANLRLQLGIDVVPPEGESDANYESTGLISVKNLSAFPLYDNALTIVSDGNRLVTKAGELIDVWLALVAGEQLKFLCEDIDDTWVDVCKCRVGSPSNLPEESSSESPLSGSDDKFETSQIERRSLRQRHARLELRRIELRIADKRHRYWLRDNFVTFMGYRMESVRSLMAQAIFSLGDTDENNAGFVGCSIRTTDPLFFVLSSSFYPSLQSSSVSSLLLKKGAQCRLIWELQNSVEKELRKEVAARNESSSSLISKGSFITNLVALFILSFPSVSVVVSPTALVSHCDRPQNAFSVGRQVDDHHVIHPRPCDCPSEIVTVRAVCAPQNHHLVLTVFQCGRGEIKVSGDTNFEWKAWRDAFLGRLDGFRCWQERLDVVSDKQFHSDDGDGKSFSEALLANGSKSTVWLEWPPFRSSICRFELEVPGTLRQIENSQELPVTVEDKKRMIYTDTSLHVRNMVSIPYDEARDIILTQTTTLLLQALQTSRFKEAESRQMLNVKSEKEELLQLAKSWYGVDDARALSILEMTVTQYQYLQALQEMVRLVIDGKYKNYLGLTISTLENFVAQSTKPAIQAGYTPPSGIWERVGSLIEQLSMQWGDILNRHEAFDGLARVLALCALHDDEKYLEDLTSIYHRLFTYSSLAHTDLWSRQIYAQYQRSIQVRTILKQGGKRLLPHRNSFKSWKLVLEGGISQVGFARKEFSIGEAVEEDVLIDRNKGWFFTHEQARYLLSTHDKFYLEVLTQLGNYYLELASMREKQNNRRLNTPSTLMEKAVKIYKRVIEIGQYPPALHKLAFVLETGENGMEVDFERAVSLYERNSDLGYVNSMMNLANIFMKGMHSVRRDPDRAKELYEAILLRRKDQGAIVNLGLLYQYGWEGQSPNTGKAELLYRNGADFDYIFAIVNYACFLETEYPDKPEQRQRAVNLYERAIDLGDDERATCFLAWTLEDGAAGVPAKPVRSVALYRKAIENHNSSRCMTRLADLLKEGSGDVQADPIEAISLYERAIETDGNENARHNLANMLQVGVDGLVDIDFPRARKLYEENVEKGHAQSMFSLAKLLFKMDNLDKRGEDKRLIIELLEKAVQGGQVEATMILGRMYETGELGQQNIPRAVELYQQAIDEDSNTIAMHFLAKILKNGRGEVAADGPRAISLMERQIAERGETLDMVGLAACMVTGLPGVSPNPSRAVELCEEAIAIDQNPWAMKFLGVLLSEEDSGVAQDKERALKLFKSAWENGCTEAKDSYEELRSELHPLQGSDTNSLTEMGIDHSTLTCQVAAIAE